MLTPAVSVGEDIPNRKWLWHWFFLKRVSFPGCLQRNTKKAHHPISGLPPQIWRFSLLVSLKNKSCVPPRKKTHIPPILTILPHQTTGTPKKKDPPTHLGPSIAPRPSLQSEDQAPVGPALPRPAPQGGGGPRIDPGPSGLGSMDRSDPSVREMQMRRCESKIGKPQRPKKEPYGNMDDFTGPSPGALILTPTWRL